MKKFKEKFKKSALELLNTQSLALIAMFLGVRIALGFLTDIQLTESIKISFTIFPTTIACMMFGPVPGMVMGGAADLIGFYLKPTGPFFPGYTLDAIVAGMIYGLYFYKREKISIFRVMAALATVVVFVNLCMTTSWISIQTGVKDFGMFFRDSDAAWESFTRKFKLIFEGRAIKNAIQYPVNVIGVFFIMTAVREVPIVKGYLKRKYLATEERTTETRVQIQQKEGI